ncbi:Putative Flp pilus-assembly TadE/G-like [Carboxydocella thermautotrophica]|nr:Putative Flp pilus-assembly TadE/G-like [Carboxydocella thermautotrophica]
MFFVEEKGTNTGWLVLLLPVLLLLLGWVTDISMLYIASNQLQHIADKAGEGALTTSIIMNAIQEEGTIKVDPVQAEANFQRLLTANAEREGWVFTDVKLTRLEIEPEGPPRLSCRLEGEYRPVFMGFWREKVTLGVESEVVLEDIP